VGVGEDLEPAKFSKSERISVVSVAICGRKSGIKANEPYPGLAISRIKITNTALVIRKLDDGILTQTTFYFLPTD
jgi:hypothetical protein